MQLLAKIRISVLEEHPIGDDFLDSFRIRLDDLVERGLMEGPYLVRSEPSSGPFQGFGVVSIECTEADEPLVQAFYRGFDVARNNPQLFGAGRRE